MRFDQSLPSLLQPTLTVIIFFPPLGTQLFPVVLLQLGLCSLSLTSFFLPLNPQFVLFLFPLVLRVVPAMMMSLHDHWSLHHHHHQPHLMVSISSILRSCCDICTWSRSMSLLDRAVLTRLLWPGLTEVRPLLWCHGDLGPAWLLLLGLRGREINIMPWRGLMFDRD